MDLNMGLENGCSYVLDLMVFISFQSANEDSFDILRYVVMLFIDRKIMMMRIQYSRRGHKL